MHAKNKNESETNKMKEKRRIQTKGRDDNQSLEENEKK